MNLYWRDEVNDSWGELSNWFEDSSFTTPAAALPTTSDDCYLWSGTMGSIPGGSYSNVTNILYGCSVGIVYLADMTIHNDGNITEVQGRVTANTRDVGTVSGTLDLNSVGGTVSVVNPGGNIPTNNGTIDTSYGTVGYNNGTIGVIGSLGDVSYNQSVVLTNSGTVTYNTAGATIQDNTGVVSINSVGGIIYLNRFGGKVVSNLGTIRIGSITGGTGSLAAAEATNLSTITGGTNVTMPSGGGGGILGAGLL